jgi:hypothetical protein
METIDFFTGIQRFRQLAPGVEASMTFEEMQSSASIAKKRIKDIVGALWDDLKTYSEGEVKDDADKNEAIGYLQGAFANLTMFNYLPFWIQTKKAEGKDFYRYEVQNQQDAYISNLWIWMDSLLDLFQAKPEAFPKWKETDTYKDREDLLIESADEFEKYYAINRSHYFFSKIIFIIKEAGADSIYPKIKDKASLDLPGNENLKIAVKKAAVFYTMGHALERLDFTELPESIRNNSRETSRTMRSGYSEGNAVSDLSKKLLLKFDKYIADIEFEMKKPEPGSDYFIATDINKESDNSYFMS